MVTETSALVQSASPTMANINVSPNGPVDNGVPQRRANDNRRSNKPIMEKRRRARINNCLNELKTLILDAMKKDPARHSKLEKADILEMTVKHLQNMQRQQTAMSVASDPTVINKFRAGFSECATEVSRFPGIDPVVKRRLLQHLANCLNQGKQEAQQQQVQVHILPTTAATEVPQSAHQTSGIILGNGGVQLVPTRLPNGDIALVLPTANTPPSTSSNPLPLLVPIPTRTASTASASSSSSSNYSTAESPEPLDVKYNNSMKPLSLVIRKAKVQEEERMWRPW
ncbi:basic helix-loop-helix transcription factor hes-related [Holotrichia oblita]|uniref:Basic helix-loop-helix transcription factor hes-related n=1 Tax=Holotrichia oblita TaxID=644536 RepID=A0ACB9T3C6_HOLOL|nr:basic helix-loop-helix transcription factor hes-related [Holotrichia oblita]